MTVLLATWNGILGGAERLALDVLSHLEGGRVLACPEGPLAEAARAAGVPVVVLAARTPRARGSVATRAGAVRHLLAHARELRRLNRELAPGTVVGWSARSVLALAAVPAGPTRVAQHNDLPVSPVVGRAIRLAARRADLVLAPSSAVARAQGGRVLPLGVDLERFAPADPPADPVVLLLGSLVAWKRPDLALEAVARAAPAHPAIRLVVAGAPIPDDPAGVALEAALRARAAEPDLAGRVAFRGSVADASTVLGAARVLLHPAEREAFGLAVAEAMASGLPVAAARAGALPEVVGDAGALFAPGDPADAARALDSVLSRPELRRAARDRAEAAYDVRRTRAQYRSALGDTRPDPRAGAAIAVVVVAHRSAPDLGRLLPSIARHLPEARVIVADAGSPDDSAAVARAHGATVLELGENVGFGAANNAAIALVEEPLTLLVNPDVEFIDGSPDALARAAGGGRILAPVLLRPDGTREPSAHPRPLSPAAVALAVGPASVFPRRVREAIEPFRARRPRSVGWALGACLAAGTDTFRRLGPFDPSLFLYGEDLDLGLRARAAGVDVVFWPDARVIHTGGTSARRAFGGEPLERLVQARRVVVERHLGTTATRLDAGLQALTHANRAALKHLIGRPAARERAYLEALRSAREP